MANPKVMECHQTNAPVKNNTKLLQNVPVQLRPQIVDLLDFLRQSLNQHWQLECWP